MFIAGLTSVADWIGSNVQFFQPVGKPSSVRRPVRRGRVLSASGPQRGERAGEARLAGPGGATTVRSRSRIIYRKAANPRPLQTAGSEIVTAMTEPSLLIVEAPMGEGKTEAAWYAAACWDREGGQGAYVALPTMATSNQMFDRVSEFLEVDAGEQSDVTAWQGGAERAV